MPSSSPEKKQEKASSVKSAPDLLRGHSLWDLVNPNKPWVLVENGSFLGFFDFIPEHYRHGPWSLIAMLFLGTLLYLLVLAATWMSLQAGWWEQFSLADDSSYQAFTNEWYYTLAAFVWMMYVAWHVYFKSPLGAAAWISFTLWSWTIVTIRHGLLLMAPWLPSVRLWTEVLRFPALLSASLTTIIWNFVLFPIIIIWFIKDAEQRRRFIGYFTNFRLTQLHVFNAFFAVTNCALVAPTRPLHIGDLGAAAVLMVVYNIFYYCVLDRLGIHLYPIFSPRTPLVVLSWMMIIAACSGGYHFWKGILAEP